MRHITLTLLVIAVSWSCGSERAEAGPWNRLGRFLGLGWSDGYHSRLPHGGRTVWVSPHHNPATGHWQPPVHQYHVPYSGRVPVSPPAMRSTAGTAFVAPSAGSSSPMLNYRQPRPPRSVLQLPAEPVLGPSQPYR